MYPPPVCLLLIVIVFSDVTCNNNLKTALATAGNLDCAKMEVYILSYLDEQAKAVQDVADLKLSVIKHSVDMLAKDQQINGTLAVMVQQPF